MSSVLTRWQLTRLARRLRSRRAELEIVGEQLVALPDGADEEAMQRHRRHLVDEIARLERRQDELLDRFGF